jgi:predicted AlkP superfamily phosphohydrolase/phosphomutase
MKRKLWLIILLILCGGIAFGGYLFSKRKNHASVAVAAPPAVRRKVYLIGIDGASWNLMRKPMSEGKLPNIQRLIQSGVSGPLQSFVPTKSPILWTSIATGKTRKKHGVGDYTAEKDGKMVPVAGNERITKAYWNILSDYGFTVGVVNWWVTWPPDQVNGYMVSDRYRNGHPEKLNLPVTYPADLVKELPQVGTSMEKYLEDRHKYGLPEDLHPDVQSKNVDMMAGSYKQYWSQDRAVRESCRRLIGSRNVDVFGVVFRIVDVSSHLLWTYLDLKMIDQLRAKEDAGTLTQQDIDGIDEKYSNIIGGVYQYADDIVGDFLKKADPNTSIIICSDHGFKFEDGRYGHSSMKTPPDGVVILSGPVFKKNAKIEGATLLDITPTLLYLEGVPVGRDMDGHILLHAFDPAFVKAHPPTVVDSHDKGMRQKGQPLSSGQDQEILEDLKSLGYIQ